ncbi:uncharacterized protein RAG0_16812 [Rhynchosporium agropyri]|uniref:Uncharacterized protein n=1 Tax=Rhynchosporium agropyri TaxID=914238 RepID=A0A1E1LS05_9HELO|nr:uncharacterized protein RAG0_16812 [Rhynchosporium agropyri]
MESPNPASVPSTGAKNIFNKFLTRIRKPAPRNPISNTEKDTNIEMEMTPPSLPLTPVFSTSPTFDNMAMPARRAQNVSFTVTDATSDTFTELESTPAVTPNIQPLPISNTIDTDIEMELITPATTTLDVMQIIDMRVKHSLYQRKINDDYFLENMEMILDDRPPSPADSAICLDFDMECTPTSSISGTELQFLRESGTLLPKLVEDKDIDMKNGNSIINSTGLDGNELMRVRRKRIESFQQRSLAFREVEMDDGFNCEGIEMEVDNPVDDLIAIFALFGIRDGDVDME